MHMRDPFKTYNEHLQRIREEYPILHEYGDLWAMEVYRQIKEGLLTEFLKTVDPQVTVKQLSKKLGAFDYDISREGIASSFIKIIFQPEDADTRLSDAVEMLKKFGWYPSAAVVEGWRYEKFSLQSAIAELYRGQEIMVIFEPTHDPEQEVPTYLYHITSQLYTDSIDKRGLIPKTHGKLAQHPGRVYLTGSKDGGSTQMEKSDLGNFVEQLYYAMKRDARQKTKEMVVYRVDTKKVNNLQLLEDPNFVSSRIKGYYTYTNIPPSAMAKVYTFNVETF